MSVETRKRRLQDVRPKTGGQEGRGLEGPRVCTANVGWTVLLTHDIDS